MLLPTLYSILSIDLIGVISAAVPVKKASSYWSISSGRICFSINLKPLFLTISITACLVIPFKKQSGIGVCILSPLIKNT